jgi:hypothetical protein
MRILYIYQFYGNNVFFPLNYHLHRQDIDIKTFLKWYLSRGVTLYVIECETLYCLYYIILFKLQVFFETSIQIVHVGLQEKMNTFCTLFYIENFIITTISFLLVPNVSSYVAYVVFFVLFCF